MRLWHEQMLPLLPRQQLLGQHREAAALRGNGWNRPHRTVNYVFTYSPVYLYAYHMKVMNEMERRGYRVEPKWKEMAYRGKQCVPYLITELDLHTLEFIPSPIYEEHNDDYRLECTENLREKGIDINIINHSSFPFL